MNFSSLIIFVVDCKVEVEIQRENDVLKCLFCDKTYHSVDSFKKHINVCKSDGSNADMNLADDDFKDMAVAIELVAVPKTTVMVATPISTKTSKMQRDYGQAIIHACQSMDATKEEKIKDKWIIERIPLEPFALISRDDDGNEVEYDALSHHKNIKSMSNRTFECRPIIPSKRPLDTNATEPSICNDLASLIYKSPHRQLLASREYFELDDTAELLLNKDWLHEPQVKFACAQVLAGAVLMNVNNGEAILVNTVEMYGGTKSADIHRELPFSLSMSIFTTKPTYANIWPHIRSTETGPNLSSSHKLVLH
ncbi:hypothetical protein RMATCC62417_10839 [Rhizopus microsporus]|nr:hypothetical protein RMATCC62417_10839 [Rhizopus microsporus]